MSKFSKLAMRATAVLDQEWAKGVDWYRTLAPDKALYLLDTLGAAGFDEAHSPDAIAAFRSAVSEMPDGALDTIRGLALMALVEVIHRAEEREEEGAEGSRG